MKRSYSDLEHQFAKLAELKAAIALTYLSNMSDDELKTIPTIAVPEEIFKYIVTTGTVIDIREGFSVYEWGTGFAVLLIKQDKP